MKRHYPVIIEQDKDGVFIVECPILKACRSYGRTINEALENIQEAIEVCLLEESTTTDEQMTFVGVRDVVQSLLRPRIRYGVGSAFAGMGGNQKLKAIRTSVNSGLA